jgi:hypothetical protein
MSDSSGLQRLIQSVEIIVLPHIVCIKGVAASAGPGLRLWPVALPVEGDKHIRDVCSGPGSVLAASVEDTAKDPPVNGQELFLQVVHRESKGGCKSVLLIILCLQDIDDPFQYRVNDGAFIRVFTK